MIKICEYCNVGYDIYPNQEWFRRFCSRRCTGLYKKFINTKSYESLFTYDSSDVVARYQQTYIENNGAL